MENGRGKAALFDDALGAEIAEIGRAQTQESAQDLVGVLADRRRVVADARRRFRQMNPGREQRRQACRRVIPLDERLARFDMRIFEHFGGR